MTMENEIGYIMLSLDSLPSVLFHRTLGVDTIMPVYSWQVVFDHPAFATRTYDEVEVVFKIDVEVLDIPNSACTTLKLHQHSIT